MMSHGLSGYTAKMRMPFLLDIEPYVPHNKATPRDAARTLVDRAKTAYPELRLHIIFDSGFGSFDELAHYTDIGVLATMSMPSKQKSWLWDLLGWSCPLDCGRTALVPVGNDNAQVLASLFHVKSDSGKLIDILTASNAFVWTAPVIVEPVVSMVGARRTNKNGFFEYETTWEDGDVTWQLASSFMDDDGKFSLRFLEIATDEDVKDALTTRTATQLVEICQAQSLKVLFSLFTVVVSFFYLDL